MNEKRKVIGIDFGSSQSSIAIMEIGKSDPPVLFRFEDSSDGEPMQTVLLLDGNDETPIAIGNKVKEQAEAKPPPAGCKFISDFKRHLGTDRNAERYAELFLKELKDQIERGESRELSSKRYVTCIACPAGWNDEQVKLLRRLVEAAGFPSDPTRGIYVLAEPVAALRAHPIDYGVTPENFLVMDFGGGTLDICVVETDIGGQAPVVRGTAGDAMLGGRDFDELLLRHLELVHKGKGLDYNSLSSFDQYKLDARIRNIKRFFSDNFVGRKDGDPVSARVEWPGVGEMELTISPGDFKNMIKAAKIDERIRLCIRKAIVDSGVSRDKITRAVLTGGSSLWFFVREIVCEECGLKDDAKSVNVSRTPFTDVAMGCALSKGRIGEVDDSDGLWVKWRFDGERSWQGPKQLLKAGRKQSEPEIRNQHLGVVMKSRLLKPYRIEFSFWEGEEGGILTPYKGGDKNRAMVDFYARSNHPILKRPMDIFNAMRGRLDLLYLSFQDTYQCFLLCKEWPNRAVDFKLEIRDWSESRKSGTIVNWDADSLFDVHLGLLSRCGRFGTATRKEIPLKSAAQTSSGRGEEAPSHSGRSLLNFIRLPKFGRKVK